MKISFFVPSLSGGGAERNMVNFANALSERHELTLLAGDLRGPYLSEVDASVRMVDLQEQRVLAAIGPLQKHIESERPDVLFTTMNHANIAAIGANLLARHRTKVVIREAMSPGMLIDQRADMKSKLLPLVMSWTYRHADLVVSPSQGVAHDLELHLGLEPGSVAVVRNPVVNEQLLEMAKAPMVPSRDAKRPFILAVGRMTWEKGYDVLLEAYATHVYERHLDLVILGEGPLRAELENQARKLGVWERVHLPGFVSNPFAFMSRCEVFVLSSRFEGLPNVPIQALACGAPVVSTDCKNGPREILRGGQDGTLVAVDDSDALGDAILTAIESERRVEKNRERGMDFHETVAARELEGILRDVVSS